MYLPCQHLVVVTCWGAAKRGIGKDVGMHGILGGLSWRLFSELGGGAGSGQWTGVFPCLEHLIVCVWKGDRDSGIHEVVVGAKMVPCDTYIPRYPEIQVHLHATLTKSQNKKPIHFLQHDSSCVYTYTHVNTNSYFN